MRRSPGSPSQMMRRLVAPRAADVAIDAVDAGVQLSADEPLRVRRLPVEHLRARALPLELAGEAGPEGLRIALGLVVDRCVAHDARRPERRRRIEVAVFAQQRVDLGVMRDVGLIAHGTHACGRSPFALRPSTWRRACVAGDRFRGLVAVRRHERRRWHAAVEAAGPGRRRRVLPEQQRAEQPAERRERRADDEHEQRTRCTRPKNEPARPLAVLEHLAQVRRHVARANRERARRTAAATRQ